MRFAQGTEVTVDTSIVHAVGFSEAYCALSTLRRSAVVHAPAAQVLARSVPLESPSATSKLVYSCYVRLSVCTYKG